MIKPLHHHGNSRTLVQSVNAVNKKLHKKAFREVLKENDALMKRLSKR